jgi:hypothetical protein
MILYPYYSSQHWIIFYPFIRTSTGWSIVVVSEPVPGDLFFLLLGQYLLSFIPVITKIFGYLLFLLSGPALNDLLFIVRPSKEWSFILYYDRHRVISILITRVPGWSLIPIAGPALGDLFAGGMKPSPGSLKGGAKWRESLLHLFVNRQYFLLSIFVR